ncbi:MAG: hypothetical protein JOZ87_28235 [Chloroflexi bacterium]|nr:hypothetical protein [Chloroflexota bacterium]
MALVLAQPSQAPALADRVLDLEQVAQAADDLDGVLAVDQLADGLAQLARISRQSLGEANRIARVRVLLAHRGGVLLRQLAEQPRPGRARQPRGDPAQFRPKLPPGTLRRYQLRGGTSSAWQSIATLRLEDIEARCRELSEAGGEVTLAEFARRGRAARRRQRKAFSSPTETRLRWSLSVLGRVRSLTSQREIELAVRVCRLTQRWALAMGSRRLDVLTRELRCTLCGRSPQLPMRCGHCGGSVLNS